MDVRSTIIIFLLVFSFNLSANNIVNLEQAKIEIDGSLSESSWSQATKKSLQFEIYPGENTEVNPQYKTSIFMFEDGQNLYIGVDALDPNPSDIRANYYKRDNARGDDRISVYIDTFNQSQRAYVFEINPIGGQTDYIMLDREEVSWDGYWTSKGRITEKGFQLEISIPLENFRFPEKDIQQWKIDIRRRFQRDNRYTLSLAPQDRNNDCTICQFQEFKLFQNAKSSQKLELRPYGIWTSEQNKDYPYDGPFIRNEEKEIGLDLKWAPSGNQILNATINPDFSQVEADDAQFSINRQFSVFYDEKRNFFLEGHENFTTPLNLVHTRNIVDPDYGAKYTGKHGAHVFGGFYAKDSITNFILPGSQSDEFISLDQESENHALRYRYDMTDTGYVGLLTTNRKSDDYESDIISVDAFYRTEDKKRRFAFQYANSENRFNNSDESGDALHFTYNYNAATTWHWLEYQKIDSDFNSGMGFITQSGFEKTYGGLGYLWNNSDRSGLWSRVYLSYGGEVKKPLSSENLDTNRLYEEHSVELNIEGKNKLDFYLVPSNIEQFHDGVTHDIDKLYLSIDYEIIDNTTMGLWSITGDGIDFSQNRLGDRNTKGVWINSVLNSQINLNGELLNNELDILGQNIFEETIVNFTVNYSLDFSHHFRLKLQNSEIVYSENQNTEEKSQGFQFLYIYQLSSYTSIYAGHSANFQEDSQIGRLEEYNNYSFLKFNHVFNY